MAMRRSALQLAVRLARCSEGVASATLRPLAIGSLAATQAATTAAAKVPARSLGTSAPSFAAEAEYSNQVFYPEPEAEVGEQAPGFTLPGAQSGRVVGADRRRQLPHAFGCPGSQRLDVMHGTACVNGMLALISLSWPQPPGSGWPPCCPGAAAAAAHRPTLHAPPPRLPAAIVDGEVKEVSLEEYVRQKKYTLLFFYPKDFT